MNTKKTIKTAIVVFAVTVVILLLAKPVCAEEGVVTGTAGTCSWTFNEDSGRLYIYPTNETGTMPDFEQYKSAPSDVPWYQYKNQIKTISIAKKVNNIGEGAFYGIGSK